MDSSAVASAESSTALSRNNVRIVVIGDQGTGKSSLIGSFDSKSFPEHVPCVLSPISLSFNRFPLTIVDTSSSLDHIKTMEECQTADAIVLTYACDSQPTLDRLSTYWLPMLQAVNVKVPVIVVGCKLDLEGDKQINLEYVMSRIMWRFPQIDICMVCSALKQIQVPEVFSHAQRAVFYPTAPLFDQESHSLKPRCRRALKRIFNFFDSDRDGALSNKELNNFQVRCFGAPLKSTEIVELKEAVKEVNPKGVNEHGVTLSGFICLHALLIECGCVKKTWDVLTEFGYHKDITIKLRDDFISSKFMRASDQSVELKNEAVEFLKGIFFKFDMDKDGFLQPAELDDVFSTAPENPWSDAPYKDAAQKNGVGALSLEGFLSEWALMTLLDPASSLANLMYIGYADLESAFHITRTRRLDNQRQQSYRNVFQCFVFGPRKAGKSALLNSFIGRQFSANYTPGTSERFAVNIVDLGAGNQKTLVMREVPENSVEALLSRTESLAACDIAVFVYDSSDERSLKKATELLVQVCSHAENNGYPVPCLIVSAKDDLESFPLSRQVTMVSQNMEIGSPISFSAKQQDVSDVFIRIVKGAQSAHLRLSKAKRGREQYHQFVPVGIVTLAVLAAFKLFTSRNNSAG